MKNKREEVLSERDLAHVDYETQRCQNMKTHAGNVALFAGEACAISELRPLIELTGLLHDAGKLGAENQDDFENILKLGNEVHKRGLDHSTAGGILAQELIKAWPVSEFISTLIYFHHGLGDCINLENGRSLRELRQEKEIEYGLIKEKFFEIYDKKLLEKYCSAAIVSYKSIYEKVKSFIKKCDLSQQKYGNGYFFMGMYLRVVLSLLIDADWTDTACFFQDILLSKRISAERTQEIWKECIDNFAQYLEKEVRNNSDNGNLLNSFRQEISDSCREASEKDQKLYRLTVPTGAGKTLSSLRFALYHAQKTKKQHIIYIAPFNSILEQNADEIRKAVGNSSVVLERA